MQGPGLLDKLFIFGGVDMVHHDAQIRTLHIVRNVFAFTERIPPE